MSLDLTKIHDIFLDGIDHADYPDFCDVYIASAVYEGRAMTDAELDALNDNAVFVHEQVFAQLLS